MKAESSYRAELLRELRLVRPLWIIFHIEDKFTTGVPDICIVANQRTAWYETKRVTAGGVVEEKGLKWERMKQLSRQSIARYIIFEPKQIIVVQPALLYFRHESGIQFTKISEVVDLIIQLQETPVGAKAAYHDAQFRT